MRKTDRVLEYDVFIASVYEQNQLGLLHLKFLDLAGLIPRECFIYPNLQVSN